MDVEVVRGLLRDLVVEQPATLYRAGVTRDPLARVEVGKGRLDPYPVYEEIRQRGPLLPVARWGAVTADHGLCRAVLHDRRWGVRVDAPTRADGQLSFLELDPPDHTRLRRLAAPAFTPRSIAGFEPRVAAVVDSLLDAVPARTPFDLVATVAAPMPIAIISDLLGIPPSESGEFARCGAAIGSALGGIRSPAHALRLLRANQRLQRIFTGVFALKRRDPGDDLITLLVHAEPEAIGPTEMVPLCTLLLVAGFETTVNLIGNAVLALLGHPDAWQALVEEPALAEAAIEETLRYDSPVQRTIRVATGHVELAGRAIPAGGMVVLLIGGANRDPAVYPDADRFELRRYAGERTAAPEHLAFSAGIHYCVGAPLARMEAATAVRRLAQRFPRLRRVGPLRRRPGSVIRGLSELVLST